MITRTDCSATCRWMRGFGMDCVQKGPGILDKARARAPPDFLVGRADVKDLCRPNITDPEHFPYVFRHLAEPLLTFLQSLFGLVAFGNVGDGSHVARDFPVLPPLGCRLPVFFLILHEMQKLVLICL